jgi:CubicO group peptidase (beta-lactamase class C family)
MKKFLKYFFGILILANIVIVASGNIYLYKAFYYNFVDIDDFKIFNNRIVEARNPKPWNIAVDYNKIKIPNQLLWKLEEYKTTAFLVVRNDSIIYENYWEDYSDTSKSGSFSVAKSIVNVLVGIALKEGKIKNIDEPVGNYIPEFKDGAKSKITIRHLLEMSSGLKWDEAYANPFSITTEAYYGTDLYNLVANLKVESEPGKIFNYQSCNSNLLSIIVNKATGKTVSEYASEKLWTPINAEQNALWSLDHKDGIEKGYCCFNSNARDFARIGKLYLNKGNWNGVQIVDTNYVEESTHPAPILRNGEANKIYGLHGWCINRMNHNIFFARGILGQYIFVVPDKKIIIVRLGHKRGEPTPDGYVTDLYTILDETIKTF